MTSPHDPQAELRAVPLLSKLGDSELQVVAEYLSSESFTSGRTIVREGEVGYVFFIIRSGRAEVTQGTDVLRALGPGDFFGEISIMSEDGKRTATVTARDDVEAWAMFGTSFRELQVRHRDIADELQAAVHERLSSE